MGWLLVFLLAQASPGATRFAQEGAALAQAGKLPEALTKLEAAARAAASDPNIAFNLGQLRELNDRRAEAAEAYERYLEIAPNAPDAAEVSARVQALRSGASASNDAQESLSRGQVFFKLERLMEAETAFRKAAELAPTWGAPLFNLAVVYETQKRWSEAVETLRRYRPLAATAERASIDERIAAAEINLEDERKAQALSAEQERARQEEQRRVAAEAQKVEEAAARQRAAEATQRELLRIAADAEAVRRVGLQQIANRRTGRALGITFLVAGAVGLAAGGYGLLRGAITNGEILAGGYLSAAEITAAVKAGETQKLLAGLGLGFGGAFAVLGCALYAGNLDPQAPRVKVALGPSGVTVWGAF